MKERPYVGVTGPTSRTEIGHIIETFEDNGYRLEKGHMPMIGILVSHSTLMGSAISNRRYPDFIHVPHLLEATGNYTFNTIHYSSRHLQDLGDQIVGVFGKGVYEDELSRAVQLNIPWPPKAELMRAKRALPDLKIIMQLSYTSLKDKSPSEVAELMAEYGGLADYALVDPSGGKGQEFDPRIILPYYSAIQDKLPDLALGLAGGFTGENVVERCEAIIKTLGTEQFSIDAEAGLRTKLSDGFGDDLYNSEKVEKYVAESAKVF